MFTWIPIHREAIHRILEYGDNQPELLAFLREMEQQGLKVISLQDKNAAGQSIPLTEIDPFTFLASFNRGLTDKNRREKQRRFHRGGSFPRTERFVRRACDPVQRGHPQSGLWQDQQQLAHPTAAPRGGH